MALKARHRRRLHAVLAGVWVIQVPVALAMPAPWRVPYLIVVSIYANVVGHWSAYSAETPVESENND